jgi:CHAD domain-containing protein
MAQEGEWEQPSEPQRSKARGTPRQHFVRYRSGQPVPPAELHLELSSSGTLPGERDMLGGQHSPDRVDRPTKPIPSSTVQFHRRATAKEAMQAICRTCLHDLTSNVGTIDGEHAVEGVHKTRIALRRLRAAMTLFKKITKDEESERLRSEMRWLSDLLGEARDLDVLQMESALPKARELSGGRELVEIVGEKRHAAHEKLLEAVRSQRFYLFLIDLVRWIEDGDWLKAASKQGDGPVARFARRTIARRRRRLLKKADHLKTLPPEARHQVRIAGKKLRYMAEFLQPLAKSKEQRREHRRFVRQLEKMQTSLGTLHDREARGDFFRDIAEMPPALTSANGAASAAISLAEVSAEDSNLLCQAAAARRKIAKIGPKNIFARG